MTDCAVIQGLLLCAKQLCHLSSILFCNFEIRAFFRSHTSQKLLWENGNVWVTDSTVCEIPDHLDPKKIKATVNQAELFFTGKELIITLAFQQMSYCVWYTGRRDIFSNAKGIFSFFFAMCGKYNENVFFTHKLNSFVTGSSQVTMLTNYGWIHVAAVWTYDPCVQVLSGCETQPKGWDRGKVKSYSLIFSAQHGVGNQRESRRLGRKREDGRKGGRKGGRVWLLLALFTGHFLSMGKVQNESLHYSR